MSQPNGLPYVRECEECQQLASDERSAREAADYSRETDMRVIARQHLGIAHNILTAVNA